MFETGSELHQQRSERTVEGRNNFEESLQRIDTFRPREESERW